MCLRSGEKKLSNEKGNNIMFNKMERDFNQFFKDFDKLSLEQKEFFSYTINKKLRDIDFSANKCVAINKSMRTIAEQYGNLDENSKVIEIGSGKFAMLSGLLWNFYGIKEYNGIDKYNIPFNDEFWLEIYKKTILDFININSNNSEQKKAILNSNWGYWKESLVIHRQDFVDIEYEDNSIDYIYSNAVFEHIDKPREVIEKMYKCMKNGAIARHVIDLRPHGRDDKSTPASILKYNETDWLRTHPTISYLNRLRNSEWKDLFKEFGFEILTLAEGKFENVTENIYNQIDKSFHHLSLETLQTRQLNITLKKV